MMTIDDPELRANIERMSDSEIDELPFGVIRLDETWSVLQLSRTEARMSGLGERHVIGRSFFTEIAPCMSAPSFLRRLEDAETRGRLDIRFSQVGDFGDASRNLNVRVTSATGGGFWMFVDRPS